MTASGAKALTLGKGSGITMKRFLNASGVSCLSLSILPTNRERQETTPDAQRRDHSTLDSRTTRTSPSTPCVGPSVRRAQGPHMAWEMFLCPFHKVFLSCRHIFSMFNPRTTTQRTPALARYEKDGRTPQHTSAEGSCVCWTANGRWCSSSRSRSAM